MDVKNDVKSEWSYGYTASSGFATEIRISEVNSLIDEFTTNRLSTRVEGDCITFIFSLELTNDEKMRMNIITQIFIDTSKPKVKLFTIYPKLDNTDSTTYTLMGRVSYKKFTSNQTLDYVDVMAKSNSAYSIKLEYNGLIMTEFAGNNTEFETLDMGTLSNVPTNDGIIEIYAKVDSGTLYIDQLQFYYNP